MKQPNALLLSLSMLLVHWPLMAQTPSNTAEQLYTEQPSVTPELAQVGTLPVGVTTIQAVNPQQLNTADFNSKIDRPLTIELWYPAKVTKDTATASYIAVTRSGKQFELQGNAYRDAPAIKTKEKFPLVVMSHGYTGYRSLMFYLAEHFASHGYVVASIDHTDSRNGDVDFSKNFGSGMPSTMYNRARDQQFTLDFLSTQKTPVANITNTDKAALIGYSMGGYGALNTLGACYNYSPASLQIMGIPEQQATALAPIFNSCNAGQAKADPRWQAMIAYAPWGAGLDTHSQLQNIKAATMYVVGDQDDISGFENGVKKLFKQTDAEHTYLMVYENARHNVVAHPAPKVAYGNDLDIGHYYEPAWKMESLNRINKHMNLAFLDCHIKALTERCAYLPNTDNITQTRKADGSMTAAWPGFPERWGAGVRFYRKEPLASQEPSAD